MTEKHLTGLDIGTQGTKIVLFCNPGTAWQITSHPSNSFVRRPVRWRKIRKINWIRSAIRKEPVSGNPMSIRIQLRQAPPLRAEKIAIHSIAFSPPATPFLKPQADELRFSGDRWFFRTIPFLARWPLWAPQAYWTCNLSNPLAVAIVRQDPSARKLWPIVRREANRKSPFCSTPAWKTSWIRKNLSNPESIGSSKNRSRAKICAAHSRNF